MAAETFLSTAGDAARRRYHDGRALLDKIVNTADDYHDAEILSVLGTEFEHRSDGTSASRFDRLSDASMLKHLLNIASSQLQVMMEMGLIYAYSLWDGLMAELIFAVLCDTPSLLKTKDVTLSLQEVLEYDTQNDLIIEHARRRVRTLMAKSVEDQLEFLRAKLRIDVFSTGDGGLVRLQDIVQRRNLIVHQGGTVDARYAKSTGLTQGSKLEFTRPQEDRFFLAQLSTNLQVGVKAWKKCPDQATRLRLRMAAAVQEEETRASQ